MSVSGLLLHCLTFFNEDDKGTKWFVVAYRIPFNIFYIYTSDAWQYFRVKISHLTRLDYQPSVGRRARAPLPNREIGRAAEIEPKARFRRRTFQEQKLIRMKTEPNYLDRLN